MREVGPELSISNADMGSPDERAGYSKTPARRGLKPGIRRGSLLRRSSFAPRPSPGYILDFPLGCRCQGVGNWELPGGVMRSKHPPVKLTTTNIWHSAVA